MELNTALEKIKQVSNKFAEEEVLFIREHKDAAIPDLLKCVRGSVDNFDEIPENIEDRDDPAYAMFLLAEFKVHETFDPFIRMLELDEDKCEWLLGDMITEDMGSLIASVADITDIERIKVVVENARINEFQRSAALRSLVIMYSEGRYQRADLLAYLRRLLDEYEDDENLVTSVVCACEDVSATEHYKRIRELFNGNKIDTCVVGDEHFAKDAPVMTEDEVLESLRSNSHTSIITDTVKSMRWWACFNEKPYTPKPASYNVPVTKQPVISSKKIGRNEPCPCGSGKKYKKCCLNKGDEASE